jgi:NH3-dependent NAD+ synthetase
MASFSIPTKDVNELHSELLCALAEERRKKNFQPDLFCEKRVAQLVLYLKTNNLKAVVLSISGGVDSGCVLGLLKKAQDLAALDSTHPFNPANGGKIIPVAQPIDSTAEIQNRAYEVAAAFGIEVITVDQSEVHHQLVNTVEQQVC